MASRISDKSSPLRALIERAERGLSLRVGVFGASASEPKEGADSAVTVLDVATWNEFGTTREGPGGARTQHVPPRPFIGGWYDEHESAARDLVRKVSRAMLVGKISHHAAHALVGTAFVGQIQRRIADGVQPANAPSTIARKGSSKPLIDSGQLRSSIAWESVPPPEKGR